MRDMAVPHAKGDPSVRALRAWTGSGPLGLALVGCGRFATFPARAARRMGGVVRIAFAGREYPRRFGGGGLRDGAVAVVAPRQAAFGDLGADKQCGAIHGDIVGRRPCHLVRDD